MCKSHQNFFDGKKITTVMISIARAECAKRAMWHDQKHEERRAEGGKPRYIYISSSWWLITSPIKFLSSTYCYIVAVLW